MSVGTWNVKDALDYSALLASVTSPTGSLDNQQAAIRDFLSLYSVVRRDDIPQAGTWNKLNFVSETEKSKIELIRAALFGDGSLSGSLISQVHIGGETYTKKVPKKENGKIVTDAKGKPVMIDGTTVHQNSYPNINAVLKKLGFSKTSNIRDHQNH